MNQIDELLGPRVEREVMDEGGGRWIVSFRPRLNGPPVVRTTIISFRPSGERVTSGIGIRLFALRLFNRADQWVNSVVYSSLLIPPSLVQSVLAWIDTFETES